MAVEFARQTGWSCQLLVVFRVGGPGSQVQATSVAFDKRLGRRRDTKQEPALHLWRAHSLTWSEAGPIWSVMEQGYMRWLQAAHA